jgi:TonB-dependent receptor
MKEGSSVAKFYHLCAWAIALAILAGGSAPAQQSTTISGTVRDSQTGEALPGANVLLVKTSLGASTDVDGRYIIRDVSPGTYSLRATYVGYNQKEIAIQVKEGQALKQDFKLMAVGVEGEEVVVTAQAAGQNEAINRQLSSMPVMNAVSAARIQELPDANAAESVARLPGVSLIRTGGEGSQVVIRGLSPQYNQITIDGVEMPSDVTSQNNITGGGGALESTGNSIGDRGGDLSMISSSMLGGIEVTKAITPDMDAAVIGGVVNFGLRKAARSTEEGGAYSASPWVPRFDLRAQYGYNKLRSLTADYKYTASVERRFADEKFGVFLQGSIERRNLSANELGVNYVLNDKTHGDAGIPDLTSMTLTDVYRDRKRLGGTLVLDYQHDNGEIGLMNFFSSSKTQAQNRGETINPMPNVNDLWMNGGETNNTLGVITNLLSVKQDIPIFHVDFKLSHSYTENNSPEDLSFAGHSIGVGYANMANITKQSPQVIASLLQPTLAGAILEPITTTETLSKERTITGSLDLQTDIALSEELSTKIKFGGMWQHRTRDFNLTVNSGSAWHEDAMVSAWLRAYPWLKTEPGGLSFENFVSSYYYDYGNFLDGEYKIAYPVNIDEMWFLLPVAKGVTMTGDRGGYRPNVLASQVNDYNGTEDKSAGYAMATVNIGERITVLPGVRYQNLTTTYSAPRGMVVPGNKLQGTDTTVTHAHGYWLPMVHARYQPTDWMQVHFAYTRTLNYPDYSMLTPRYVISTGYIDYNNHALRPATSENLDLVVAFHSNEIGLLSFDGFRKRIKDLVFFSHTYISNLSQYPDLPQGGNQLYTFNTYINNPNTIDLYGIETEWQTHFWYLPKPFDGLVLNINYTHIFSEAKYPRSIVYTTYDDEGRATQTVSDTFYTARMLNQPNDILNLVLGYDIGGFSARVSMLYQDNIFKNPDFWMQQRVYSAKYTRWDISVKQDLPWYGIQLFVNINNLTGAIERDLNQKTLYPANEEHYGMSADLGFRVVI